MDIQPLQIQSQSARQMGELLNTMTEAQLNLADKMLRVEASEAVAETTSGIDVMA